MIRCLLNRQAKRSQDSGIVKPLVIWCDLVRFGASLEGFPLRAILQQYIKSGEGRLTEPIAWLV